MKNLAIIPARSGSKGVPNKNIRNLCGRPLIAHSIIAALESGEFDEVMVSTDSESYADVAREWGATVPFLRSGVNSGDTSSSWDMVDEVLSNYEEDGVEFDSFCLLQPTSPLRSSRDISEAYALYRSRGAVSVVSVCEVEHSPRIMGSLGPDMSLDGFLQRDSIGARQQYGKCYRLNGAIYVVSVKDFRKDRFLYREGSFAYVMSQASSVDIDTEIDFYIAECLARRLGVFG